MTCLKLLDYICLISLKQGCILNKQYEQVALKLFECENYLGAWINSDRKRLSM